MRAFLAWEDEQPERHEFYRGELFRDVGARRVHGLVVGNVVASLKQQLRGRRCQAGGVLLADELFDGVEPPPGWQASLPI